MITMEIIWKHGRPKVHSNFTLCITDSEVLKPQCVFITEVAFI